MSGPSTTTLASAVHDDGTGMLLLQPFLLGDLELRNRVVMAPLTWTRATLRGAIPNQLMREYYRGLWELLSHPFTVLQAIILGCRSKELDFNHHKRKRS